MVRYFKLNFVRKCTIIRSNNNVVHVETIDCYIITMNYITMNYCYIIFIPNQFLNKSISLMGLGQEFRGRTRLVKINIGYWLQAIDRSPTDLFLTNNICAMLLILLIGCCKIFCV